jgi:2'-5' RNA ligase
VHLRRSATRIAWRGDDEGMFLQAVIIPPRGVLESVMDAVSDAVPTPFPGHQAAGLQPATAGHLTLPIAALGSVSMGDAIRVGAALKDAATHWLCPTVSFAGATVHEFPQHRAVAMTMDGEVDELLAIARAATHCLQRRGFHFDRRKFLPLLSVARIMDTATAAQVMVYLDALHGFTSQAWTVDHVSLARRSFDVNADFAEYQPIPLGA